MSPLYAPDMTGASRYPGFVTTAWYHNVPGNNSDVTPTEAEIRTAPLFLPRPTAFTAARVDCITTPGTAGAVVRIGFYLDNGSGYPGALYQDLGTVAATSTGALTITTNFTLPGGMIWPCAVVQGAAGTRPTLRCSSNFNPWVGSQDPTTGSANAGWSHTGATGALPANFTSTIFSTSNCIRVHVRAA